MVDITLGLKVSDPFFGNGSVDGMDGRTSGSYSWNIELTLILKVTSIGYRSLLN